MLVEKISPEWIPSENPDLNVGDTIEITSPGDLFEKGYAKKVTFKKQTEKKAKEVKDQVVETKNGLMGKIKNAVNKIKGEK